MRLGEIVALFETVAPPSLQESYDNSGLIVGSLSDEVNKALLCLDSTEEVVDEAIEKKCDLIIAHHPIIFSGLKKLNGKNYVERAVIKAIKHGIAIYACHTNLDNVFHTGVNSKIAEKLGLERCKILAPKAGLLRKLVVFTPTSHAGAVREAIFAAGAGQIGAYSECSFNVAGEGTFKPGGGTKPYAGEQGKQHTEVEIRMEAVLPEHLAGIVVSAMQLAHPYEEVAYDIYPLQNEWKETGSGMIGYMSKPLAPDAFLAFVKDKMGLKVIKHTATSYALIEKVAICGGAGSFLIKEAMKNEAQAYITSDVKYHEFFDAEGTMLLCDIGHYESEKYTIELFASLLSDKLPNFATIFSKTGTNPVQYYY